MTTSRRPLLLRHLLPLLAAVAPLAAGPSAAAWQAASPPSDRVTWIERDPGLPAGLFAASADGLFHSADAGETWRPLDARPFDRVAVSPSDPSRVYAVDKEDTFLFGVYRSDDGGASFAKVSQLVGGGFLLDGLVLVVDPTAAERLFVGLATRHLELATDTDNDVLRSTDGGRTWQSIRWFPESTAQGGKAVRDLAIAPTDPQRLYAATQLGLDRSDDGGETWRSVRAGSWSHLAVDPLDEDRLFAAAAGSEGMLWTTGDGGTSWARADAGLPDHAVRDLLFDPIDRGVLYVALEEFETVLLGRVFASRDGGATWSLVDEPIAAPIGPLAVAATAPRRLLAVSAWEARRTAFDLPLCPERSTALCLHDDRFLVEVAREDFQGGRGAGFAAPLTADAGTFWFFEPDNVELAVKVLDARTVNDHWWVFFGALTNVEFDLRVTDLARGASRLYHNPSGRFASRGDAAAFPAGAAPAATGPAAAWFRMLPGRDVAGACADDATTLCLLDRFRVNVTWQHPTGHRGAGQARPLTGETGWFWFFDDDNPELFVKVLDGRTVNGHWWVFYGSLTDVEFDVEVEDSVGGGRATYHHPAGTFASHGDTTAIP